VTLLKKLIAKSEPPDPKKEFEAKAQSILDDIHSMEEEVTDLKKELDRLNLLRDDDPIHLAHTDEIGDLLEDLIDLEFEISEKTNFLESYLAKFLGKKQDEPSIDGPAGENSLSTPHGN
jgi:hypothetical protein